MLQTTDGLNHFIDLVYVERVKHDANLLIVSSGTDSSHPDTAHVEAHLRNVGTTLRSTLHMYLSTIFPNRRHNLFAP